MKSTGALKVSGVSSGYAEAIVIRDVTLEIEAGEIFALFGKNGMGKTTLIKTVLGFLPAQIGRVEVFGEDVTRLPAFTSLPGEALPIRPRSRPCFKILRQGEPPAGTAKRPSAGH